MIYSIPSSHLIQKTNPETGEVYGVLSRTGKRVIKLTTPSKFYSYKTTSNAFGRFYEVYAAWILGASRAYNAPRSIPDIQLNAEMEELPLIFESKASYKTNGVVLKRNQLRKFSGFSNLFYILIFHNCINPQSRWNEGKIERRKIRQELTEISSCFIVPAQVMQEYYEANQYKEQPLRHYGSLDEANIKVTETHMKDVFATYSGPLPTACDRVFHIISSELSINSAASGPKIIRI